jgi:radical SAM superfamily enzyme YgiQ (UPF0313 family)
MNVLLISTYELGHQPFGLASPAAWLRSAGSNVTCLDLAVQTLDETAVKAADLIACYVPMHTATRMVAQLIPQIRAINPTTHLCCYGLYAPVNEPYLRRLGVNSILGGEFESGLVSLFERLTLNGGSTGSFLQTELNISLERQQFLVPDRGGLPPLSQYAWLQTAAGERQEVGYTEASRGCKHLCRHCPIVPVYQGRFRIVQKDVVLADIRQQIEAGSRHITFGDPDFFNGLGHTIPLVKALHDEFPNLTYDVTIKIEHLHKHAGYLPVLRDTGCLFVTSAVESVDDHVLEIFDKGHTRADFIEAVELMRRVGLILNPTFVSFTPWTTPESYLDMLSLIDELELVTTVAPIQYAIRLLIPAGSRLLELPDVGTLVGPFDESALSYSWSHPASVMDSLYEIIFRLVQGNQMEDGTRQRLFNRVWRAALEASPNYEGRRLRENGRSLTAEPIPHLSESWY